MMTRQYRAGQHVEDYCRQCKEDRTHTIIVVDAPHRQRNVGRPFQGAEQIDSRRPDMPNDIESLIRRIIREESGFTSVAPAEKWRGGQLVLRPGKPGVQEKAGPSKCSSTRW